MTRRIHWQPALIGHWPLLLVLGIEGFSVAGWDAVRLAPAADGIEAFQREAWWVDLAMTTCVRGIVAMLVELLPQRRRTGQVGLDRWHRGRRRNMNAEQVFDGPSSADHGR